MKYSIFLFVSSLVLTSAYILAPSGTSKADADWWKTAIFYQIYPRSFKDSNGDGVGDIKGVIEKMDHLKEAGVQATWLSPIMKSPQADFGYDISDFKDIDPLFGTMEDFEVMVAKAKELDIKIIMDFVPNHSSDEHEWFKKSVENDTEYRDFYVWHEGKVDREGRRTPPNNWQSVFYGSAWEWNDKRKKYYLHQFHKKQPDLNFRNPKVVEAMKDVLRFWLDKGASGFRVDAINHLFEVEGLQDEPLTGWTNDPDDYGYTHHYYTKDLDETYDMVQQWRALLDEYTAEHDTEAKIIMTEAYANQTFTIKFYNYNSHFPFNFGFIENLRDYNTAYDIRQIIDDWMDLMPKGATANWVLGNHDKPRVGSRFGFERHDGMLAIEMTLPGVAVTYNGEEIGMLDYRGISWEDTQDPQACNGGQEGYQERSRDPQRTPFQWDDSNNGGFSTGDKTWLPMHPDYRINNLALQKTMAKSHFSFYKDLTALRQKSVLKHGAFRTWIFGDKIYCQIRETEDDHIIVVVNLSYEWQTIDLTRAINVGNQVEILTVSHRSSYNKGEILDARNLQVRSYDALILHKK